MKNQRGQMKIQQMAFMLITVFIFFALIGLFIISFKMTGLREQATNLQEKNTMLLLTKLAESPEFSCGESFRNTKTNCVDLDKIMALKNNINIYQNFWGVNTIEIRKIYPEIEEEILCNAQSYPNCNIIEVYSKEGAEEGIGLSNFVSLCRKNEENGISYDKCELGRIIVGYEIK